MKNKYYKEINLLAFPILMNYIVTTIFEVADKAIVGQYSSESFAVISIAASVIYVITGSLGIFSVAYNIVCAKYKGKNDKEMFQKSFGTSIFISIIIGMFFIVIGLIFGKTFFGDIYGIKGNALEILLSYFYVASSTVGLNLILFIFSVYFRNKNNTRISFYSTVVSTLVNIFFDYSLVYGKFGFKELGAKGAAWGSVIGLIFGIAVYIIAMINIDGKLIKIAVDKLCMKKMIKLYIPLLLQDIMECTIFTMVITGIVARIGLEESAVYALFDTLSNLIILPTFAYSSAAMTMIIQEREKKKYKDIKDILKITIYIYLIFLISISIVCIIFPKDILGIIVSDEEIINEAVKVLGCVLIVQIIRVFYEIFKSYLQGIDKEKFVLVSYVIVSVISMIIIFFLAEFFEIAGIYIGLGINYLILLFVYYGKIKVVK